MSGKRHQHHHGGHICGIVVLGFTVLFVIFLLLNPTGREFFVPARTLIAVKLLIHFCERLFFVLGIFSCSSFLSQGNIVGVVIITRGRIWGVKLPRGDEF